MNDNKLKKPKMNFIDFEKTIPDPPKYTKEQKIVLKALDHLGIAKYKAKINNGDFDYAMGLLEALLFGDDK